MTHKLDLGAVFLFGVLAAIGVAIFSSFQKVSTSSYNTAGQNAIAADIVQANANALATQAQEQTAQFNTVGQLGSQALQAGTQLESQTLASNTAVQELSMTNQARLDQLTKEGQITTSLANISAANQQTIASTQANAQTSIAQQQASASKTASMWGGIGNIFNGILGAFGL